MAFLPWGSLRKPFKKSLGYFKHSNIHILGIPKGEEKELEIENLFEKIMKENFPNLVKEIDIQVHEAQRVPNKMDAKRPIPRHIIIKTPKVKYKERILKAASYQMVATWEGGEGEKQQRTRDTWLPLIGPQLGTEPHNPGMCPDQEPNWQTFGSQAGTQSTEPHQPGLPFHSK